METSTWECEGTRLKLVLQITNMVAFLLIRARLGFTVVRLVI